jgi:hypothetical protein
VDESKVAAVPSVAPPPMPANDDKKETKNGMQQHTKQMNSVELCQLEPVVMTKPEILSHFKDEWLQRTGKVVAILEKKNNRMAAGHLKLFADKNKEHALFCPNDYRMPRIKIKMTDCPPGYLEFYLI